MPSYKHIALLLIPSAAPAFAADSVFYQNTLGYPLSDADNYTYDLVQNALQHPNATRSIQFKPLSGAPEE
jgi:hypothetical protein